MMSYDGKWNQRSSDTIEQVDIKKRYWFVCEGMNTEVSYIRHLNARRNDIGINALIELCPYQKQGNDRGITDPTSLMNYTIKLLNENKIEDYDAEYDRIVVVFDVDVFQRNNDSNGLAKVYQLGVDKNFLLGLTNPCFELFLLLHFKNSYTDVIKPNEGLILQNDKISNARRYVQGLLGQYVEAKTKSKTIGALAAHVKTAIEQEVNINQDPKKCIGTLTSTIGKLIEKIISESLDIEALPIRNLKNQTYTLESKKI